MKSETTPKKRKYTKIEDGSPIGLAIVALGGLIVSNVDELANNPDVIWIVFGTASMAAGLSRLIRNSKK